MEMAKTIGPITHVTINEQVIQNQTINSVLIGYFDTNNRFIDRISTLSDFEYSLINEFDHESTLHWTGGKIKSIYTYKLPKKDELIEYLYNIEKGFISEDVGMVSRLAYLMKRIEEVRALKPQTDEEFAILFKLTGGAE